ncbi:MAG: hypothetical protein IJ204_05545 [Paludibacteraceae bacterium]|nr:hypothetical protein [Paludibacteraceae bacterium]
MNNHTYIVSRGLLFAAILFAATLSFSACGVKNGYVVGEYGKYPLSGEIIAAETNDSVQAVKGTMSLLWQGDSLRITLNQGRQLLRAKTGKDTLYLYEAPRGAESDLQAQAANDTTRQYAIYLPTRELFVIKYNDSLVYPVMPTAEPCNYPLEIEAVGIRPSKKYYGAFSGMRVPWEYYPGKHMRMCKAADYLSMDSTRILFIHLDGTWQTYTNNILTNTGIIRRNYIPSFQTLYNNNFKELYAIDTLSIAGHIHRLKEMPKNSELPWTPGEYYKSGFYLNIAFILTPVKKDNLKCMLFDDSSGGIFIEEGIYPCGWMKIKYLTKHKYRYE